ncbi:MAG: flagellar filament capping protein FliD, partial [Sedimentisphaerales bacterium]|nr:flagellar filament capping protein FliD [Sedimentisphaerales bacterium]
IEDIISDINDADIGVQASLINDGSGYRISFNSEVSGGNGTVHLDAGSTNLTTDTLSYGRDAILFLGDGTDEHPLLIRSSSNTIKNAIGGTTLELHSASDEAVEITVEQDLDSIITQIEGFVEAYNSLMDDLDEAAKFDPETYERGILFSDSAISTIRSAAQNLVMRAVPGLSSQVNRLAKVGVAFGSFGNEMITGPDGKQVSVAVARTPKLVFDKDQFRQTFADDPEGVAELFTKADTGIGDSIADRLDNLAGDDESTIKNRLDSMMSRQRLFEDRIENIDKLLLSKEGRLYRQFYAMEQALGSMQSQQSALSSLSSMAASFRK